MQNTHGHTAPCGREASASAATSTRLLRSPAQPAAPSSRIRCNVRICLLKLEDIGLSSISIRVFGKGRRERTLPLWKTAASALRAWLAVRGRVAAPEVFVNAHREPLRLRLSA
jgi:hypothetical protein